MGDTTYSVRIDEETKDKIGILIKDSGLNSKDFMQELILAYEINKTKELVPAMEQDLNELQALTKRINSIYINIGERIDSINKAKDLEYKGAIDKKEDIINTLQDKIKTLEEVNSIINADVFRLQDVNKTLEEENVNFKNELLEEVNKFTDINNTNKALIEEYKSKIDAMAATLEEYKQYQKNYQDVEKALEEVEHERDNFSNSNIKLHNENNNLKANVENLKIKHIEEVETLKDKLIFEKDKALLEQEKRHQEHMQKLQEEYNSKVKDLLNEIEANRKVKADKVNKILKQKE